MPPPTPPRPPTPPAAGAAPLVAIRGTARTRHPVPVKTIVVTVALVLATAAAIEVVIKLRRVIIWVAIATFFAVVLHPAVEFGVQRLRLRRTVAALIVFLLGMAMLGAAAYAFIQPIVNQVNDFVNSFPAYVNDAKAGRGNIGHLVKRYHIDSYVDRNQSNLKAALKTAEKPLVHLAKGVVNTLAAAATIIVVTFLMLIEGPRMMESGLAVLSPTHRAQVEEMLTDATTALSGYVAGNLATGIIAGGVCYLTLMALGVPFRGVLALWVGFTTIIPLVGAVIGAIPAVTVAFIHSTPAGIATIVVLVVYQQIENRTFHRRIMARTIALTPLAAVVSVLVGWDLLGILGVLLAIPAAGVINVVIRDLWRYRRMRRRGIPAAMTTASEDRRT
jgi:predicted PurR-regulated permease PerM